MVSFQMMVFTFGIWLLLKSGLIASQQWMKLALSSSNIHTQRICDNYKFWSESQRELCMQYTELIPKITKGAEMAYYECRHQFRWRRWNCFAIRPPSSTNQLLRIFDKESLFGKNFEPEGKEAAFINAIFSAGVAYSVTKACSSNQLESCRCESIATTDSKVHGFVWHQCNDNVQFGVEFAKRFVDSVESNLNVERMYKSHSRSLMDSHNNGVGRTVVGEMLAQRCGCHGVSGSCTTQICSRELASFPSIGSILQKKSDSAIHAKLKYINTHQVMLPLDSNRVPLTNNDLIYLKSSPTYCNATSGRRCKGIKKKAATGKGSCANMCCGNGHRVKMKTVIKPCKCEFVWCCKVKCQKCLHKRKVFICK